jgi:glycosyltransferase involved in cell wall biosynthesis
MHILYIHQHFAVPAGSTGTRSYEFGRRWVKAGHKVTVICGRGDICGLPEQSEFNIEGIEVNVIGAAYSQKQSFVRRIWAFLYFIFACIGHGIRIKNVEVIYATSTPLTIGIPAMMISWIKRIPYVFEVRDQWPESVIEVGVLQNKLLIKILLWLEKIIYKNASAIVAVSEGMAESIREIAGNKKPVHVVPNGADLDMFRPDIDGGSYRQQKGWGNKLVFLHAGAMGKINGLDFIIDVAQKLKNYNDILFVLIGQGFKKGDLENTIRELGLSNVEILHSVSKQQLPPILAAADVAIVIIGNFPIIERHASLNKFYDGLSAGKPVLLNYSGWQRRMLEENNAGYGTHLCDADEFAKKVRELVLQKDRLKEMGHNARHLAETRFSRDKLAADVLRLLESVI